MARTKGAIAKPRTLEAGKLRGALKKIFRRFAAAGVPKGLVSPDHVIEQLPRLIDWTKVDDWAAQLAAAAKPPIVVKVPRKPKGA